MDMDMDLNTLNALKNEREFDIPVEYGMGMPVSDHVSMHAGYRSRLCTSTT